jgi:PHD/YefM family antitoxin component YafN of YafNO toxin-antitoxin module
MAVLEVTSRQFREKQKRFFEIVDTGRQVMIKRRNKPSYILTPVEEEDKFEVTPALLAAIERAEQQMREGKVTVCKTLEDNLRLLDSL